MICRWKLIRSRRFWIVPIPHPRCSYLIHTKSDPEPEPSNKYYSGEHRCLYVRTYIVLSVEEWKSQGRFKFKFPSSISIFPQKMSRVVFQIAWVKFCWIDHELSKSYSARCHPFTILQLPDRADSRPVSGSVRSRGYRCLRFQSAAS